MPPRQALVVTTGRRKGHEKDLREGIYLVGRSKKCQIRPKNRAVSRRHCAILCIDGKVFIQDVGSKSGTFVNEDRLTEQRRYELSDGDLLRIGRTEFQMKIEQAQAAQEPSLKAATTATVQEAAVVGTATVSTWQEGSYTSGFSDDDSSDQESERSSSEQSSSNILDMLEEEDEPAGKGSNSGPITTITSIVEPVEEEDLPASADEDQEVDFMAPGGKKLADSESVPSYALRQDWDVVGARSFANKMQAEPKANPKPAKPAPKRLKSAGPSFSIDGDLIKNAAIFVGILAVLAVFAWNIYQLVAFDG